MAHSSRLPGDSYPVGLGRPRDNSDFFTSTTSLCSIRSANLFYKESRPDTPLDAPLPAPPHRDDEYDMADQAEEVIQDGSPSPSPSPSNARISLAPSIASPHPLSPTSTRSSPYALSRAGSKTFRRKPVPPYNIALPDDDFGSGINSPPNYQVTIPSPVESRSRSSEDVGRGEADLPRSASMRRVVGQVPGIERRVPLPSDTAGVPTFPVPPHRSSSHGWSSNPSRAISPVARTSSDDGRGAYAKWLRDAPGSGANAEEGAQLDDSIKQQSMLALGGSSDKTFPPLPTSMVPASPELALAPRRGSSHGQTGRSHKSADSTATVSSAPVVTPRTSTNDLRVANWMPVSGGSSTPFATATLSRSSTSSQGASAPVVTAGPTSKDTQGEKKKKVRRGDKVKPLYPGEPKVDRTFSIDRIPSKPRLLEAASCFVRDEDGKSISFGEFFPSSGPSPSGAPVQKTVVFFIRSFWCGMCQDYTLASISILSPEALEKAGMRVVVIAHGDWKVIKGYRKMFGCPFPLYVDSTRKLYELMGMRMRLNWGPNWFKGRAEYHQRNVPKQMFSGTHNAVFKLHNFNPGSGMQQGGEFVLTPGINCEFAHRMTHASDHMEAPDVLRIAGCASPTKDEVREIELADEQIKELETLEREIRAWRLERSAELDRIKAKKAARRGRAFITHDEGEHEIEEEEADLQHTSPSLPPIPESAPTTPTAAINRLPVSRLLSHPSDSHKSRTQYESEWDSRFELVMRQEEMKAKERAAAQMMTTCLVMPPDMVSEELDEEALGEAIIQGQRGLVG